MAITLLLLLLGGSLAGVLGYMKFHPRAEAWLADRAKPAEPGLATIPPPPRVEADRLRKPPPADPSAAPARRGQTGLDAKSE